MSATGTVGRGFKQAPSEEIVLHVPLAMLARIDRIAVEKGLLRETIAGALLNRGLDSYLVDEGQETALKSLEERLSTELGQVRAAELVAEFRNASAREVAAMARENRQDIRERGEPV